MKIVLHARPLKIKGLVKRPIQFGDAVFVVLHINKFHATGHEENTFFNLR